MAPLLLQLFEQQLNGLVGCVLSLEFGGGASHIGAEFLPSALELVARSFEMLMLFVELLLAASQIGLASANVVDKLSGLCGEQRIGTIRRRLVVERRSGPGVGWRAISAERLGQVVLIVGRIEAGVLRTGWVGPIEPSDSKASGWTFSAAFFALVASELIASHRA